MQNTYAYDTRNKTDLHLFGINSSFGQRCIKYKGALLWNKLLTYIKSISSTNRFKLELRLYLQNNDLD